MLLLKTWTGWCCLAKVKGFLARVCLPLVLSVSGIANAVTILDDYVYKAENFYGAAPQPTGAAGVCGDCVGELFLRMSEPELVTEGGVEYVSVSFSATATFSTRFTTELEESGQIPYLGNIGFQVSVGGSGIDLSPDSCMVMQGDRAEYGLGVNEGESSPVSVELSGLRPGAITGADPSDGTHYSLSDTVPVTLGTLRCQLGSEPGMNGVNAYVLNPSFIDGNEVQLASTDSRTLILRATNSFEDYPLHGKPLFAVEPEAIADSTNVEIIVTNNNVPGFVSTAFNFEFSGCAGNAPLLRPTTFTGVSPVIDIEFDSLQANQDCIVTFDVMYQGNNIFSNLTQQVGRLPGQLVEINVLLGGAVRGSVPSTPYMTTDLAEIKRLPLTDPYCETYVDECTDVKLTTDRSPNSTTADVVTGETVGVTDWILVEVRAATTETASEFFDDTVVARIPALLLSNGAVVDADKFVNLSESERAICASITRHENSTNANIELPGRAFTGGKYVRVVIRHRNHLDIMSNDVLSVRGDEVSTFGLTGIGDVYTPLGRTSVWKFEEGVTSGTLARILSPYSDYAFMVPGDTDGDGNVRPIDVTGSTGYVGTPRDSRARVYALADTNLDDRVRPNDVTDRGYVTARSGGATRSYVPGARR